MAGSESSTTCPPRATTVYSFLLLSPVRTITKKEVRFVLSNIDHALQHFSQDNHNFRQTQPESE